VKSNSYRTYNKSERLTGNQVAAYTACLTGVGAVLLGPAVFLFTGPIILGTTLGLMKGDKQW